VADVTMCKGTSCPLKDTCYRFTAPANEYWQSFFTDVPFDKDTEFCDHFWEDTRNKPKAKRTKK
jgi:hypothetical protein